MWFGEMAASTLSLCGAQHASAAAQCASDRDDCRKRRMLHQETFANRQCLEHQKPPQHLRCANVLLSASNEQCPSMLVSAQRVLTTRRRMKRKY